MSTIITIPTELEPILTGRAIARGKALEEYALDVLKREADFTDPWESFADVREQIKATGTTDEELEAAVKEVRARRRA